MCTASVHNTSQTGSVLYLSDSTPCSWSSGRLRSNSVPWWSILRI